jgi:hypothetical protein
MRPSLCLSGRKTLFIERVGHWVGAVGPEESDWVARRRVQRAQVAEKPIQIEAPTMAEMAPGAESMREDQLTKNWQTARTELLCVSILLTISQTFCFLPADL